LQAQDPDTGLVNVLIDTPKGSRNKYKYDEKLALFRLGKVLPLNSSAQQGKCSGLGKGKGLTLW
jgi:inorganic pyrophosphatase